MPDAIGTSPSYAASYAATYATNGTSGTGDTTEQGPGLDPAMLEPPDPFGQDMFLKLMVAQLKYQNPLSPMDGSEFMAQTAQFTTVEKLNELTETISASLMNDRLGTATGMIGRDVTYAGDDGNAATSAVKSVRFTVTGPLLILADGRELGMGEVQSVAAASAAPQPAAPAAAQPPPAAEAPAAEDVPAEETAQSETDSADPAETA
ncbi:flagellar hook assembly protein FlgD [Euzebya sp.]|uniref:flagellar hook assembly protein FlgD n=1 Tax=Euzebya sp. TaxID=1971409 RepID=UPI003512E5B0